MIWLLLILPGLTAVLAVVNRLTWPRGQAGARCPERLSFLVPMRNEERHARGCLDALSVAAGANDEILVFDDGSTDDTLAIAQACARQDKRIKVLSRAELPQTWVGKSFACHQLGQAATGDWLVFVDADVRLKPKAAEHLHHLATRHAADVVTMTPHQAMKTPMEQLVIPLLHLSYVSWLPLALIPKTRDPRILAANGQVLAVSAQRYRRMGGHQAVAHAIVEDMAFCRVAKEQGATVVFADGEPTASCRMYVGSRETLEGFAKNLCLGVGGPAALGVVSVLYLLAFVVPWILLAASVWSPDLFAVGAAGVLLNLFARSLPVFSHGHRWWTPLAHPASMVVFFLVAGRSWWWATRGRIVWRDRVYPAKPIKEGL